MKGRYICKCVVCGLEKGDRDPNTGWWIFVPRDVSQRLQSTRGLNFCPSCAAAPLIRSDEAQSAGSPGESKLWRMVRVHWLNGVIALVHRAGRDNPDLRNTIAWRLAEDVASLIGFRGLPKALQLREFGFIPEETP